MEACIEECWATLVLNAAKVHWQNGTLTTSFYTTYISLNIHCDGVLVLLQTN